MSADYNLKDLWLKQHTAASVPEKELAAKANRMKYKTRNKMLANIILLLATMIFILGIVYYAKPQMITTKIGIVLVCLAILMHVVVSGNLVYFLSKRNSEDMSVKDYLAQMITMREKQIFIQGKVFSIYTALLSVGMFLYLIEYTRLMHTTAMLLSYGLTFLWIGFAWFYIKPRTIRKQQAKVNEIIEQLKKTNSQFE